MEILGDVNELQSLTQEMKRLREQSKALRQRKTEVEKKILEYLESSDQPGLKYKDIILLAENKETFKRGKAKDRILRGAEFLEQIGIDNGKQVITRLLEAIKGSPIPKSQLKLLKKKKRDLE